MQDNLPVVSPAQASDFAALGLSETLLRALRQEGHTTPTPIQAAAIPPALLGRDLFGCAQTGTGKTAAFVLPIVHQMLQRPAAREAGVRALILTPTRELAAQIGERIGVYARFTGLRHAVIYGGVGMQNQVQALRAGLDLLVATPGRLVDLMAQGLVRLQRVEFFVLDEADRMLDEGFLPSIRRVVGVLPKQRQTLLFSATMPPEIAPLAAQVLRDPLHIEATPVASAPEAIEQSVYFVAQEHKRDLLRHVLGDGAVTRAIVFTRTKHGADRVARQLAQGQIHAEAIHGDKAQSTRLRALSRFRDGQVRVLVATDLAARGIDVSGISHVINYDLPMDPEAYVHRIGRTARAGSQGVALSFCSGEEQVRLKGIERLIRRRVPIVHNHPFAGTVDDSQPARAQPQQARPQQPRQQQQRAQQPRQQRPQQQPRQQQRPAGAPARGAQGNRRATVR
ncbi:DEAD/DEAH box helicase [Nannocystis punicea]|uniref:DEAD/DEAH box helicase n=1 Tax=Nannocystis punicea TaxID=2995304 RepID=A0ABY7H2V8_9BACT|nr:DEAD/DEAH box helicase [Nannocystis poenicansa]WAS93532.1 DEAD/DEAH box helicase [Nannocystis poenicansa]